MNEKRFPGPQVMPVPVDGISTMANPAPNAPTPCATSNEHIGVIGKRKMLTLTLTRWIDFRSTSGVGYWVTFTDEDGNTVKWDTGNPFSLLGDEPEIGATVSVTARIARHFKYEGKNHTTITRPCLVKGA